MSFDDDLSLVQNLADFRYVVRRFLLFSEEAAAKVGLPAQQHQLMLQIAGARAGCVTTIAYLAERMSLKHHSVGELADRCEAAGLVVRLADPGNKRLAVLGLTDEGRRVLESLSQEHAKELKVLGPRLVQSVRKFTS